MRLRFVERDLGAGLQRAGDVKPGAWKSYRGNGAVLRAGESAYPSGPDAPGLLAARHLGGCAFMPPYRPNPGLGMDSRPRGGAWRRHDEANSLARLPACGRRMRSGCCRPSQAAASSRRRRARAQPAPQDPAFPPPPGQQPGRRGRIRRFRRRRPNPAAGLGISATAAAAASGPPPAWRLLPPPAGGGFAPAAVAAAAAPGRQKAARSASTFPVIREEVEKSGGVIKAASERKASRERSARCSRFSPPRKARWSRSWKPTRSFAACRRRSSPRSRATTPRP